MRSVTVDGVSCHSHDGQGLCIRVFPFLQLLLSDSIVDIISRKAAAGHIQSNLVTCLEQVACDIKVYFYAVNLTRNEIDGLCERLTEAGTPDAAGQVHSKAIREIHARGVHIYQPAAYM
jgi:hypothetical protein